MTAWREPVAPPTPLRQEPTRELQHIRDHLRGSLRTYAQDPDIEGKLDDLMAVVGVMCLPVTMDEAASRLGPGWTRRHIETRMERILDVLMLDQGGRRQTTGYAVTRVGLVRRVLGVDRCWCDF